MVKYGSWEGAGLGAGIALPVPTQLRTTPGTPSPYPTTRYTARSRHRGPNSAVGLKSVAQLT